MKEKRRMPKAYVFLIRPMMTPRVPRRRGHNGFESLYSKTLLLLLLTISQVVCSGKHRFIVTNLRNICALNAINKATEVAAAPAEFGWRDSDLVNRRHSTRLSVWPWPRRAVVILLRINSIQLRRLILTSFPRDVKENVPLRRKKRKKRTCASAGAQYRTSHRVRPQAGAVKPALERSPERRISVISSGAR